MNGKLLALNGPIGSGKTTIAKALVLQGMHRERFAGTLKAMLRTMGLTEAQVDGDEKELPCDLLGGKAPRAGLTTLGEEWGRQHFGENVWVRCTMKKVDALLAAGTNVVIDDCRYDNEAQAVRDRDGIIVRLHRPGFVIPHSAHASEAGLSPALVDTTICNDVLHETITSVQAALRYWYE